MNPLDEIEEMAVKETFTLRVDTNLILNASGPTGGSIFQIPLLGLTILTIARRSTNDLATTELTRWTIATLLRQYQTLRISGRRIAWSVIFRKHCAEAILFLEQTGLIEVLEVPTRQIRATNAGTSFLRSLRNRSDEIGLLARGLDHSATAALQGGMDLL